MNRKVALILAIVAVVIFLVLYFLPQMSCTAQGGRLATAGRLQKEYCFLPASDAGGNCTDDNQCDGGCLPPEGAQSGEHNVTGVCNEWKGPRFGCHGILMNGTVETICID